MRTVERQELGFVFDAGPTPQLQSPHVELPWRGLVRASLAWEASPEDARRAAASLHEALSPRATVVVEQHDHLARAAAPAPAYTLAVQRRKAGIDRDEFVRYYEDVYVPAAIAQLGDPPFDTYTTGVVRDVLGEFDWDGVTFNDYSTERALRQHTVDQIAEVTSRTTPSGFVALVEKYSGRSLTYQTPGL